MTWIVGMDELGGTRISSRDYFKEVCTVPVSTSTGIKPTPPLYLYLKHANWPFNPAAVLLFGAALPLYEGEITQRGGAEQHPPRLRLRSNLISQVNPTRKHTYNSQ